MLLAGGREQFALNPGCGLSIIMFSNFVLMSIKRRLRTNNAAVFNFYNVCDESLEVVPWGLCFSCFCKRFCNEKLFSSRSSFQTSLFKHAGQLFILFCRMQTL